MAAAARLGARVSPSRIWPSASPSILQVFGAASACIGRLEPDGSLVTLAWAGTGWGDRLDPVELARHGVRFVVAKPFQAAEVLHRVGDALAAGEET